jgi:hypothetical protein
MSTNIIRDELKKLENKKAGKRYRPYLDDNSVESKSPTPVKKSPADLRKELEGSTEETLTKRDSPCSAEGKCWLLTERRPNG